MPAKARTLLLALLLCPSITHGGTSAPNSSVATSRDGSRILVMLSPEPLYDGAPTTTLPDGRVISLHDSFPKSGVYDASTLAPVWQVDWFALGHDLLYDDDLRHVVRRNRKGFRREWAIAFYRDGKMIRTYDTASLLTGPNPDWFLPYTTWDWHTRWYEDFDLAPDRRSVLLSTARRRLYADGREIDLGLQEFYTFDLATGQLMTRRVAGAWRIAACVIASFASALALLAAARRLFGRSALLPLPFAIPFAAHALYQPINVDWTVVRFGCGCPPLEDPHAFRFNANHFNTILWCVIASVCALAWCLLLRPQFTDRKSKPYRIAQWVGLLIILNICATRLAKEMWL